MKQPNPTGAGGAQKKQPKFRRIDVDDRSGPNVLILIGIVLILAFVAWRFIEKLSNDADIAVDDEALGEQLTEELDRQRASRINPDTFGAPLGNFESALFSTLSATGTATLDGDAIVQQSLALSAALRERGRSIDRDLAAFVDDIAARAADSNFSLADLAEVRSQWLRQRRQYLRPAPWLVDESSVDDTSLELYQEVVVSLFGYLDEATSVAFDLQDTDPADARREWQQFAQAWRQDVENLRQDLPEASLRGARYSDLHRQLENAITAVAALASADLLTGDIEQRAQPATDAADGVQNQIDALRTDTGEQ